MKKKTMKLTAVLALVLVVSGVSAFATAGGKNDPLVSLSYLNEKLKDDIHLNNTEMTRWDFAGGFISHISPKTKVKVFSFAKSGLAYFLAQNGVTCISPSECVCILKETARMLIKKEETNA